MNGLDAYVDAFFSQLARSGVRDVVVSPGSRSAPLAAAAHRNVELGTWVHHDERVAGFFALGLARASQRPVALVCTSGTAAANYHPALIEADASGVPLLALTADRPPELRAWGSNQTIDQINLFGSSVRFFADMPEPRHANPEHAAHMAARAVATAAGTDPGPVHLNWPFRKPLEPDGSKAAARPIRVERGVTAAGETELQRVHQLAAHSRGLIVAGGLLPDDGLRNAVHRFSLATGWPILADPMSQLRFGLDDSAPVVGAYDLMLGAARLRAELEPAVVVRFGATPTSTLLQEWLRSIEAHHVLVDGKGRWQDPDHRADEVLVCEPTELLAGFQGPSNPDEQWLTAWLEAAEQVATLAEKVVANEALTEPQVAMTYVRSLQEHDLVHLGSSMPIRDVDAYAGPTALAIDVFGNRGASGIDGSVSAALGLSAADAGHASALIGDLALLHDIGGLVSAGRLGLDLAIIVPNNNGGGIFSMLPIADYGEEVAFQRLFHTPHDLALGALVEAAGAHYSRTTDVDALAAALTSARADGGLHVIEVPIDNDRSVNVRRAVRAAVTDLYR